MPKIGKRKLSEFEYYLKGGKKRKFEYNSKCKTCENDCKQSYRSILIQCPKYKSKK